MKDKQEINVKQLLDIDPDMAEPEETKLNEITNVYGLLKVIKTYIDWTNADNMDALCATNFDIIINKISERQASSQKYK